MISKTLRQWTSGILAMMLLLMLIPVLPVQAAGPQTIDISNLYHVSTAGGLAPSDDTQVPRMTTNPISVTANITNITSSEVQTIYYIVTNMNIGNPDDEKSNKAVLSTSGNEITFNNVYLTEGLNKIELVMGDSTQIKSAPAWVYFTPTTTISEFTVQGTPFKADTIYPTTYNSSETALLFKGYSPNTKTVQAYRYGEDSFPKTVMPDNSNYFYILGDNAAKGDCQLSTQIICLKPGDNSVTFNSSNDSNYYQFIKNIIYNNGQPFPYLTRIMPTADVATVPFSDNHLMVKEQDRTFSTKNLTIKTKLKVDVIPDAATPANAVPKYDRASIYINNDTATPVNLTLGTTTASGTNSAWGTVSSIAYNAADSVSNNYRVYDLTLTLTNIPAITSSKQTVTFRFTDTASQQTPVESLYNFYYNDTNASLVENVKRGTGNVTLSDSTTITNEINVLPETLIIQTNDKTSDVKLSIDGQAPQTLPVTQVGSVYQATKTFQTTDLTDGDHQISIVPVNRADGLENPSGSKSYKIKINTAPFVIFKQLYNGMILDSAAEIAAFASLQGQVMNYDKTGTGNSISLYINPPTKDDLTPYLGAGNTFTYNPPLPLPATQVPTFASQIKEGKNTIMVEIRIAGVLVRTQSYEVYKFSTLAPQFQSVEPIDTGDMFVAAQTPDKYSTTEKTVSFSGVAVNATGPIKVTVHSKDAQDAPVVETSGANTAITLDKTRFTDYIATTSTVDGKTTFTTNPIKLPLNYNVVVEFSATNSTNTIATKAITIVREAVPYAIKSPSLINNEDGIPQANVNSNFIDISLEAENATSVFFGKEEAYKDTTDGYYKYSVVGLKAGKNTIKFTVYRGTEKTDGSFVVYNANTTVQGASYKAKLAPKLKIFNGELNLSFPKGTLLMRSEANVNGETFMTADRYMYFGVADSNDGRVEKGSKYPAGSELAVSKLTKDSIVDRFRPASKLFFIDGGTIPATYDSTSNPPQSESAYREDALVTGSGRDPYAPGRLSPYFFMRDPRNSVIPTQNGELTLKFDSNIRDDAWKYVTVFHFDVFQEFGANRYEWKNIGGVVDMGNNTITVPISKFGYYQVMYMDKSFDDVTDHSFARNELDTLYSKGIMKGKSTFSFFPNEAITRGEFATMLVKIFDLPLNYDGDKTFIDVFTTSSLLNTLYDYKYIETAARAGIIRGTSSNRFKPDDAITRQDMAIMIARAANLKLSNDTNKSLTTLQKLFTDANGIDLYARTAVEAVTKAELIEGIPNVMVEGQKKETLRFDPKENFTRAQAAIVAMRVLAQQKKVPK